MDTLNAGHAMGAPGERSGPGPSRRIAPTYGRIDLDAIRLRARSTVRDEGLVRAGLLVAIDRGSRNDRILLTRRSRALHDHPGEICLPGGKHRPQDRDLAATALREAFEEVGLVQHELEPVAALDDVVVGGRFVATPIVAIARVRTSLLLDRREVDDATWAGVTDLRRRGVAKSWTDGGGVKRYSFALNGWPIAGATARILHQVLNPAPPA